MLKERTKRKWLINTNRKLKKCYGVSYIELADLTHNIAKQVNSCVHKLNNNLNEVLANSEEYSLTKVASNTAEICIDCLKNITNLIDNTIPSKENK